MSPELLEIFAQDAEKAIAFLEALSVNGNLGALDDKNNQSYTITVHGMKGSLAAIGEKELSETAYKLEKAGRARDSAVILAETPAFLDGLRSVVKKVKPPQAGGDNNFEEDSEYLSAQLRLIYSAALQYDGKSVKNSLTLLKSKSWTQNTNELLSFINISLLHSDFAEIAETAEAYLSVGFGLNFGF